ncbi:hypothetical protein N5C93_27250 [Pseudomonas nitroreducens]|uniref:Uncharacterized protein n=1 Tax=Pseudomonas nitroreducens TaxID=46680 RepID=A0ABS0KP53_PSENT|nr:hypothetical protein [Pseudomonas nitroreducens]MBG6289825.1 hypothetical protein [Pseudomonas nitroreducens]MDG9857371.1 hypothetical protein [Pseudomonas nitroreducens]MDH1076536.1 hypothetical protein [Pseudomonas nitroreducens]
MNSKSKPRVNLNLGDAIALLSCAVGCIHIALIVSSSFTLWPVTPIEILGGLFGTVGMLIYFILILMVWMCVGLFIGLIVTAIRSRRELGLF